jgi:hypothetical protein
MEGVEREKNEESLSEFIATEARRLALVSWDQVRLVFISAHDPESPLARLPMELVVIVAKLTMELPSQCSGLRLLRRLRERARQSSQGRSSVAFFYERIGNVRNGFMFMYHRPTSATPAGMRPRITITRLYQKKPPHSVHSRSTHHTNWSKGTFLAMLTHNPQWRAWVREDEILKQVCSN